MSDSGSESSASTAVAIDIPKPRRGLGNHHYHHPAPPSPIDSMPLSSGSYPSRYMGLHRSSITALSLSETIESSDEEDEGNLREEDTGEQERHPSSPSQQQRSSGIAATTSQEGIPLQASPVPHTSHRPRRRSSNQYTPFSTSPLSHHSWTSRHYKHPPATVVTSATSPSQSPPPPSFALNGSRSSYRRRSSGNYGSASGSGLGIAKTPPSSPSPSIFSTSSSFVGSYENSLLSGRMANKPKNSDNAIPFTATLGVLGLGKSIPRGLKCPDHLNLEFGAYFWDFDGYQSSRSEKASPSAPGLNVIDGIPSPSQSVPITGKSLGKSSPYVGTLEIEDYYFNQLEDTIQATSNAFANPDVHPEHDAAMEATLQSAVQHKFPGYRIPPKGQVQLVIKNANQTAVKLFLVPYDLTDMPPGTKTFIRQKSYDTVTVTEPSTPSSPSGYSSPTLSPATSPSPTPNSQTRTKETLRYAVHLQFCAPPLKERERGRKKSGHIPTAVGRRGGMHIQHQIHHGRRAGAPASPSPSRRSERGYEHEESPHRKGSPSPSPSPARARHSVNTSQHHNLSPKAARSGDRTTASHIYLHKNIRVVFAPRALDLSEKLKVVLEGPTGSQVQSSSTSVASTCDNSPTSTPSSTSNMISMDRFTPYNGPGEEWEQLKKRKYHADRALERRMQLEDPVPLDPNAASLSATSSVVQLSSSSGFSALHLGDSPRQDASHSHPHPEPYALLNTPPYRLIATAGHPSDASDSPHASNASAYDSHVSGRPPLSDSSTTPSRLQNSPDGLPEPLTFQRSPTPATAALPALMESGLSISRPGSRGEMRNSRSNSHKRQERQSVAVSEHFPADDCIR